MISTMTTTKKNKLKITYRKVAELIPFMNNARTHSEEQVREIAASIEEFGFTNPVLLDGDSGVIAGHGRLKGAELLSIEEVPTVELGHLTEAQKRAYILADNRLAEKAGWDDHLLTLELGDLINEDIDIELTGFSQEEIDELLDFGGEFPGLNDKDRDPFRQRTFVLHDDQAEIVELALTKARTHVEIDTGLNENSNGNAITFICEQFLAGDSENDDVVEK